MDRGNDRHPHRERVARLNAMAQVLLLGRGKVSGEAARSKLLSVAERCLGLDKTFRASPPQEKRSVLVASFMQNEDAFYFGMEVAVHTFQRRLQAYAAVGAPIIPRATLVDIFSNLDDIYDIAGLFRRQMELHVSIESDWSDPALVNQGAEAIVLGLVEVADSLSVYSLFMTNFSRSRYYLDTLKSSTAALDTFLHVQEMCENLTLSSLLCLPLVRIPYYILVCTELLAAYGSSVSIGSQLQVLLDRLRFIFDETTDVAQNMHSRMQVAFVQEKVFQRSIQLLTSSRYFISSGELRKKWNNTSLKVSKDKKYVFYLFNDIILYGEKTGETCKFKHCISLSQLTVADAGDGYAFTLSSYGSQKDLTLLASSNDDKKEWIDKIRAAADRFTQESANQALYDVEAEVLNVKKPIKLFNNWVEHRMDIGSSYFYQVKTGNTSLALEENKKKKSTFRTTVKDGTCMHTGCSSRVLMGGDGKYCGEHGTIENSRRSSTHATSSAVQPLRSLATMSEPILDDDIPPPPPPEDDSDLTEASPPPVPRFSPDPTSPVRSGFPTRLSGAKPLPPARRPLPSRSQRPTPPSRSQRPTPPSRSQQPTPPSRSQQPTPPSRAQQPTPPVAPKRPDPPAVQRRPDSPSVPVRAGLLDGIRGASLASLRKTPKPSSTAAPAVTATKPVGQMSIAEQAMAKRRQMMPKQEEPPLPASPTPTTAPSLRLSRKLSGSPPPPMRRAAKPATPSEPAVPETLDELEAKQKAIEERLARNRGSPSRTVGPKARPLRRQFSKTDVSAPATTLAEAAKNPKPTPPAPKPKPPAPKKVVWSKVWSQEYGMHYFWNVDTNAVTWEEPADYDASIDV